MTSLLDGWPAKIQEGPLLITYDQPDENPTLVTKLFELLPGTAYETSFPYAFFKSILEEWGLGLSFLKKHWAITFCPWHKNNNSSNFLSLTWIAVLTWFIFSVKASTVFLFQPRKQAFKWLSLLGKSIK